MTHGPLLESNAALDNAPELRTRASRDGYLFFRDLIDRDAILTVRRQITRILQEEGWLDAGTDPVQALSTQPARIEGQEAFFVAYRRILKLEAFHGLAHAPRVLAMLRLLFNDEVLVHPRNIARVIFHDTPATPAHQDFLHIRGTPDTWTAWIVLGDVARDAGALEVLAGSHTRGLLPTVAMSGAGGAGIEDQHLERQWLTADYRAGDVLLFHSLTIHRGMPMARPGRLRLSVDFRYQGLSQAVHPSSLLPHHNRQTWDEIYEGWSSRELQRYWERLPLHLDEKKQTVASGY
jgi:ectoine hydroxylase-related dioxygenase (phytanoyl-CoA dioxygenase family)